MTEPRRMRPYEHHKRTADWDWNLNMIGVLLGTNGVVIGRYLMGEAYPNTRMVKKLEALLGWTAQQQLDLIPIAGKDMRYAMVLHQELEEWKIQNPRTTPAAQLRSRFPSKHEDPFGWKNRQADD